MATTRGNALWLRLVFALNGVAIATWFPRIPDVKSTLQLDLFWLSICFFMLPVGTLVGFAFATRLMQRFGARRTTVIAGATMILCFFLPALAGTGFTLGAALLAVGLAIAPIEVAMNTKAGEFEARHNRRIMSSCHAFWSFGSMGGAMIGGAFAQAAIPFQTQQALVIPILAATSIAIALRLEPDDSADTGPEPSGMALPTPAMMALCLLPMGALLTEGAMMEWSALFLRGDVGLTPLIASVAYGVFALVMAVARLVGDPVASAVGVRQIIVGSAAISAVGMAGFATSTAPAQAILSAALIGAGIANIYPQTMSLAAQFPGASAGRTIAAVAFTAFFAFLVGPPLIGTIGSFWGLPAALALLAPIAIYPIFIASRVVQTSTARTEA